MSLRILHLSDLHLGPEANASLGDYKLEVIPFAERQSRQGHIRNTLASLVRLLESQPLDAIVVSGDVSYRGQSDGFLDFVPLLDSLGDCKPSNDRILVVPGNHDVAWNTKASIRARYEDFIIHIRQAGFRTPLLEGVDISAEDGSDLGLTIHDPIIDLGSVALVGINSANYCGIVEELQSLNATDLDAIAAQATAKPGSRFARIAKELQRLRMHDVCRISQGQIIALQRRLSIVTANDPWRVRVGALHHHLLPVSEDEEIKTFESMSNLGQFRKFLASEDFRAVFHGHKHTPNVQLDVVGGDHDVRANLQLDRPPVLVSSAATIWNDSGGEAFRVVEIDDALPSLRHIRVFSIPSTGAGGVISRPLNEVGTAVCLKRYSRHKILVFEGATVDDVYAQLRFAFPSDLSAIIPNVVCRIEDGSTARIPPVDYPEPSGEDKQTWFDDTIEWWQSKRPSLVYPQFNHGQRIHDFRHDHIDQLDAAVASLDKSTGTSRAVITLFEPRDKRDGSHPQPAFCLLQFRVSDNKVHCTGYFRKHQMRAWWPINVGEIARLQKEVCERLGNVPGEIITISAMALGGTDRPRVIVPWVDRVVDSELWDLAIATFSPDHPRRNEVGGLWEKVFGDWQPQVPRERDGAPVALFGIEVLARATLACNAIFPNDGGDALSGHLSHLFSVNLKYWNDDFNVSNDEDARNVLFDSWSSEVDRDRSAIEEAVAGVISETE